MSNPYAVTYIPVEELVVSEGIWVDGKCLVVPKKAVLPTRCILTNQPLEPKDLRTRILEWAPSFRLVLQRDRCELTYGINWNYRRRALTIRFVFIVVVILLIWAFLGPCALFGLIVGALSFFQPMDRLKVVRVADGRFWITGFSPAFLDACEIQSGSASQSELKL